MCYLYIQSIIAIQIVRLCSKQTQFNILNIENTFHTCQNMEVTQLTIEIQIQFFMYTASETGSQRIKVNEAQC